MRQWTIDAFAAAPFKGNPACVVEPFDAWPETAWMQALARENNQPETAYLLRTDDPARFGLRWFTSLLEVPLCGHATLASGHALFSELGVEADVITFDTLSGPLTTARRPTGYEMDFPAYPPRSVPVLDGLAAVLGAEPMEAFEGQWVVALLESEAAVRALKPDMEAVKRSVGNVIVTALADPGKAYQVVSRVFGPALGIPEDPATGSAHTLLSPLWSARLGKATLAFHQAYPGRGGDMECEHRGERVLLRGSAVTVVESQLRLEPK